MEGMWNLAEWSTEQIMMTSTFGAVAIFLLIWRQLFKNWFTASLKNSLPGFNVPSLLPIVRHLYDKKKANIPVVVSLLEMAIGFCRLFETERIFQLRTFFFKPFVFIYKPETMQAVLSSHAVAKKRAFQYQFLYPFIGKNLNLREGIEWKERRRVMHYAFHRRVLKDYYQVFNEKSNILVEKLEKLVKEPCVNIVPLITACAVDIAGQTTMGVELNMQDGNHENLIKAVHENGDTVILRMFSPWFFPDAFFFYSNTGRKFKANMEIIHRLTKPVIEDRMKSLLSSAAEMKKMQGGHRSVLDVLLEHHIKDPSSITYAGVTDEVNSMMVGSHEMTGNPMCWVMYCLGLEEKVQQKVHQELDDIFGREMKRQIVEEDLTRMKYLERVIKETLRLFPPAAVIGRESTADFEAGGRTVSKGCSLLLLLSVLHRDPESFPDPEKFDPDRFTPENCAKRHPYAYVPFSSGPMNCIGQKFAYMEIKIVIANILRRFHVKSLDARDKAVMKQSIVTRSAKPLRMSFTLRNQA